MVPVIALVGRPNVGKSTLFNRLTRTRDAIVGDLSGLTRDRQYGEAKWQGRSYILVDTGGISGDEHGMDEKIKFCLPSPIHVVHPVNPAEAAFVATIVC
ncbi:GTPase, partial [Pseudomonas bubulae]|uniref:GTPase n=1 Tax=Pseudomonas bubulae TaxID=2316085 RepID=UPI003D0367D3